ncbi:MAG: Fic family protein [Collinsella sp.]
MGVYLNCFWQPDSGGMNKAERMGGPYHPYLPDALADYELLLSPSCASAVADAQEALARLELSGSRIDTEPLARMMLRAEAVSSSRIEGLEMPAGKLLEYEELDRLGVDHRLDGTEAQILGNLHTLVDGLARAVAGSPLTVEEVCELNRVLLTGTRLAERRGHPRRTELDRRQSRQPGRRRLRAPLSRCRAGSHGRPRRLRQSQRAPPIATAAIAHAQLETIHPFADGNGRAGRALVHLILKKGGTTRVTVPPISLLLATDRERYIANLAAFRFEGDDGTKRREAVNGWVEYFARTTCEACSRASAFEETLLAIREGWRAKVPFREGSAGAQLLDILLGTPVISIKTAQDLTGKSYPAARTAVGELAAAGILRQNAKNRKSGIFVAGDVVEASQCLRALAGHHLG